MLKNICSRRYVNSFLHNVQTKTSSHLKKLKITTEEITLDIHYFLGKYLITHIIYTEEVIIDIYLFTWILGIYRYYNKYILEKKFTTRLLSFIWQYPQRFQASQSKHNSYLLRLHN